MPRFVTWCSLVATVIKILNKKKGIICFLGDRLYMRKSVLFNFRMKKLGLVSIKRKIVIEYRKMVDAGENS